MAFGICNQVESNLYGWYNRAYGCNTNSNCILFAYQHSEKVRICSISPRPVNNVQEENNEPSSALGSGKINEIGHKLLLKTSTRYDSA